jgi:hypothetical protein
MSILAPPHRGSSSLLVLFRSLWGCEAHLPYRLAAGDKLRQFTILKEAGYGGIEASLLDLGRDAAERRDAVAAMRELDLKLIVGIYSSWTDYGEDWRDLHGSVADQLRTFESQLDEVKELRAEHDVLHRINAHSGSDGWSEQQAREFFATALSITRSTEKKGSSASALVSHETHRGRPLANPFLCYRLCRSLEDLRLTLDASHWFVVCERLLGGSLGGSFDWEEGGGRDQDGDDAAPADEAAMLRFLCERVDHIHARVGTPESPQLTRLPGGRGGGGGGGGGTTWEDSAVVAHEQLWKAAWAAQRRKWPQGRGGRVGGGGGGCDYFVTATPEYGPAPYTPMEAGTGEPLSDVWEVTNEAAGQLRELCCGDIK